MDFGHLRVKEHSFSEIRTFHSKAVLHKVESMRSMTRI
jgi:hypothetical protein